MSGTDRGADEKEIVLRPCAKLNLTLEVVGRRPDGYHDLASVFQAIDLRDLLRVSPGDDLRFSCDQPELGGEGNLVWRAARLIQAEAGVATGATLHLAKRIPVAAGLGGGSADAAAALVGLDRLWGLGWPRARLAALAARLGSDVPFFLDGPTARAGGRGEQLTPLPALPAHWAIVVRPALRHPPPADKTRRLYAALRADDYRDGRSTARLSELIAAGLLVGQIDPSLLTNSFERAARDLFPEVGEAAERMLAAGAPWSHLAGSGPCLYTLLPGGRASEDRRALALAESLRASGLETYLARTLASPPLA